jgi:hypothetical protein
LQQIVAQRLRIKQQKNMQKIYRKQKTILVKKIYKLEKLCEINIAIIICQNNRYFIYRSIDRQL